MTIDDRLGFLGNNVVGSPCLELILLKIDERFVSSAGLAGHDVAVCWRAGDNMVDSVKGAIFVGFTAWEMSRPKIEDTSGFPVGYISPRIEVNLDKFGAEPIIDGLAVAEVTSLKTDVSCTSPVGKGADECPKTDDTREVCAA